MLPKCFYKYDFDPNHVKTGSHTETQYKCESQNKSYRLQSTRERRARLSFDSILHTKHTPYGAVIDYSMLFMYFDHSNILFSKQYNL